eukprot:TRINITY_DN65156_c0_g2_i2.p1 TRINITY_DN65156_c0_g2~~TRINITY_DN65156_c0_g2_i2.p1  ORF type:complete len:640 (-),score=120.59 TRINITY_DN65156_c0_g2_i2:56-1975(-)
MDALLQSLASIHGLSKKAQDEFAALLLHSEQKNAELEQQNRSLEAKMKSQGLLANAVAEAEVEAKKLKSVDICFVCDCTASMTDLIEEVKQKIVAIARFAAVRMGKQAKIRLAFVGFRDYCDEVKILRLPFVDKSEQAEEYLERVHAMGGGDDCEDVIGGMEEALKLDWQATHRIMYLICDSPSHGSRFYPSDGQSLSDDCPGDKKQHAACNAVFDKMKMMRVNFVGLKAKQHGHVDKMFDVFRQLHSFGKADLTTTIADVRDNAADLMLSVTTTLSKTLTDSWTKLALPVAQPETTEFTSEFKIPIEPNVNWDKYREWSFHHTIATQYAMKSLSDFSTDVFTPRIYMRLQPFAEGAQRYAYPAVSADTCKRLVIKMHKNKSPTFDAKAAVAGDVFTQATAACLAVEFSQVMPQAPLQFVAAVELSIPSMSHLPRTSFVAELFIEGNYEKYTNNAGYIAKDSCVAQCFSHWTWQFSGAQLMVTDIQGVTNNLTDPQIHTIGRKGGYSRGNLGLDGMNKFFMRHECSALCQQLKLQKLALQPPDDEVVSLGSEDSCYSWEFKEAEVFDPKTRRLASLLNPLQCQASCNTIVKFKSPEDYTNRMKLHGGIEIKSLADFNGRWHLVLTPCLHRLAETAKSAQ